MLHHILRFSVRGASINPAQKAVEDLQSEIKLLHWHKLANDAALKVGN